jgi:hypothetical protein
LWADYKSLLKLRTRNIVRNNDLDAAINSYIDTPGLGDDEDEYKTWKRVEPIVAEGVDPIKY